VNLILTFDGAVGVVLEVLVELLQLLRIELALIELLWFYVYYCCYCYCYYGFDLSLFSILLIVDVDSSYPDGLNINLYIGSSSSKSLLFFFSSSMNNLKSK